jgi:hypothetical protein
MAGSPLEGQEAASDPVIDALPDGAPYPVVHLDIAVVRAQVLVAR